MNEQVLYAVAFGRVSTPKQGVFGDSLDDQEKQTDMAKLRLEQQLKSKIKIVKTFEFTESASVSLILQPLQKVLEFCRQNKSVRFVFIKSMDRYTRAGAVVYGQLKAEFAKIGVSPIDTYGIINSQEVNTLEHLGIEYSWSKFQPSLITELLEAERSKGEVRDIQTRMIGASIRYVRAGYWRGAVPLGYITERVETLEHGKRLILKPHPQESLWFTAMFELTAQKTKTEEEIIEVVNNMGFLTRKKIYHDKKNGNKPIANKGSIKLNAKMLRNYLKNPIYAGVNTEYWLTIRGELKPVYTKGVSVISIDLFNRANSGKIKIVDENGQPKIYKRLSPEWQKHKLKLNPEFPLKQYLLCPICRRNVKGSSPRGKRKPIPTYHCAVGHKYWGINAKKLDIIIKEYIKNIRFSDKFINNFEANFIKNWNLRMEQLNKNAINWEQRIIDLREKKKMFEDKLKMATTRDGFQVIEEELGTIKQDIANATVERSKTEDEEVDIQTLANTAKYWMEHFEELVLFTPNPLTKAALFGQIFEELPTVEELKNGTPEISHLFALNAKSTKGVSLLSGIDEIRTRNLFRDREAL